MTIDKLVEKEIELNATDSFVSRSLETACKLVGNIVGLHNVNHARVIRFRDRTVVRVVVSTSQSKPHNVLSYFVDVTDKYVNQYKIYKVLGSRNVRPYGKNMFVDFLQKTYNKRIVNNLL